MSRVARRGVLLDLGECALQCFKTLGLLVFALVNHRQKFGERDLKLAEERVVQRFLSFDPPVAWMNRRIAELLDHGQVLASKIPRPLLSRSGLDLSQ